MDSSGINVGDRGEVQDEVLNGGANGSCPDLRLLLMASDSLLNGVHVGEVEGGVDAHNQDMVLDSRLRVLQDVPVKAGDQIFVRQPMSEFGALS